MLMTVAFAGTYVETLLTSKDMDMMQRGALHNNCIVICGAILFTLMLPLHVKRVRDAGADTSIVFVGIGALYLAFAAALAVGPLVQLYGEVAYAICKEGVERAGKLVVLFAGARTFWIELMPSGYYGEKW